MTPRSRRSIRLGTIAVLTLVLASCADAIPQNSLDSVSPQGNEINGLFWLVFWIATAIFVAVEAALVVAVVRFRRRKNDDRPVKQVHGNTRLEIVWTIIPAVIMAVIAVPTLQTLFEIRAKVPESENPLQVNVIGHQWWWEFEYPQYGFTTAQEMYMPAGRKVQLNITSADVIHSFWTPRLMGKRDAVPGRINHLTYYTDEVGEYLGQCAEFCGLAHADMRHMVKVLPEPEFEAWAAKHATPPTIPDTGLAAQGWTTFSQICVACHVVDGAGGPVTDPSADLQTKVDTLSGWSIAPNLSYFAERQRFGGWVFTTDEPHLKSWLQDPQNLKPMQPELNDLENGRILGMPNFGLSDDEINGLVALLSALDPDNDVRQG